MTTETRKPTLDELRAMLAQFDAAEVKQALKQAVQEKPTMLSVTMDAYLACTANGGTTTEAVVQDATKRAITAELIKPTETATTASVAAIMRYAQAYEAAAARVAKAQPSELEGDHEIMTEPADAGASEPEGKPAHITVVDSKRKSA